MRSLLALVVLSAHVCAGEPPVECSLAGLFAPQAGWRALSSGHAGCEGAQWIGETLHYAAHHDGFAFTWSEATGLVVWRKDSPEATSFRPDGMGGFYVVEQTTRQLARWNARGERVEVLATHFDGKKLNRPNDCVVKSDGTVWFSDPDWLFTRRPQDTKELPGQYVFRFDPARKILTKAAEGFDKPNGIVFSPTEEHLFLTDSGTGHVYRFPVRADGTLGEREVFTATAGKGVDGLALSPQGHVWVCTREGIRIIALDGQVLGLLKTPGTPTSIAFDGTGRLAVTTREACFVTRHR
jgi:gluconolactonase